MEKFIPYEKLSKKGSDTTAAGGGFREWSEWQRSARCKSALPDAASAGHRNRDQRKMDLARRQTWGELNPVTRKPTNSKAYNRNKARDWKREYHEPIPGILLSMISQRGTSYPSVSNCPEVYLQSPSVFRGAVPRRGIQPE